MVIVARCRRKEAQGACGCSSLFDPTLKTSLSFYLARFAFTLRVLQIFHVQVGSAAWVILENRARNSARTFDLSFFQTRRYTHDERRRESKAAATVVNCHRRHHVISHPFLSDVSNSTLDLSPDSFPRRQS